MNKNTKKALVLLAVSTLLVSCTPKNVSAESSKTPSTQEECENYDFEVIEYKVVKGDNLSKIARKYYGESKYWKEIAIFNEMEKPDLIRTGQILLLPKNLEDLLNYVRIFEEDEIKEHTVQEGDTLHELCRYYYGTVYRKLVWKVATYNKMSNPHTIRKGQVLKFPSYENILKVKAKDYSACYPYDKKETEEHYCDEHCYTTANLYDSVTGEYLGQTRVLKPHTN